MSENGLELRQGFKQIKIHVLLDYDEHKHMHIELSVS